MRIVNGGRHHNQRGGGGGVSYAAELLGGAAQGFAYAFDRDSAINRRLAGSQYDGRVAGFPHTFTRATTATYFTAGRLMQTAASGALRLDHDPLTGDALGYRSETAATNSVRVSGDLSSSGWNLDNGGTGVLPVRTGNTGTAPDGTVTATRVQLDRGAGTGFSRIRQTQSGLASAVYTASIFVRTYDSAARDVAVAADTANATRAVTGDWKRQSVTKSPASTSAGPGILLQNTLSTSQAADLLLWGAQLEAGEFATSYIPTPTVSSATRNADTLSIAATDVAWSATGGVVTLSGRTALGSGTQVFFQADDGTEDERIRIVRDSSNNLRCIVTDGGVEQANLVLGAVANDTDFAVSFGWTANDFAASLNGGAAVTDASGTIPAISTIRVGCSVTGEQCCGTIATLSYLPR